MVKRSRLDRPETEKSVKTQAPDPTPFFLSHFSPSLAFAKFQQSDLWEGRLIPVLLLSQHPSLTPHLRQYT